MLKSLAICDDLGRSYSMQPGNRVIIGRSAEIVIGSDDPYLHRKLLQVWDNQGVWQLDNLGDRVVVQIVSAQDGAGNMILGPKESLFIPNGQWYLVFETIIRKYELSLEITGPRLSPLMPAPSQNDNDPTRGAIRTNREQAQLLIVLTEKLRKYPGVGDEAIPTVAQCAQTLGWTEKKTNSKIENLVKQISAQDRLLNRPYRVSLARYAYQTGLVSDFDG